MWSRRRKTWRRDIQGKEFSEREHQGGVGRSMAEGKSVWWVERWVDSHFDSTNGRWMEYGGTEVMGIMGRGHTLDTFWWPCQQHLLTNSLRVQGKSVVQKNPSSEPKQLEEGLTRGNDSTGAGRGGEIWGSVWEAPGLGFLFAIQVNAIARYLEYALAWVYKLGGCHCVGVLQNTVETQPIISRKLKGTWWVGAIGWKRRDQCCHMLLLG